MSNVLLFADEPILAAGIRRVFDNTPGLEFAGNCTSLEELEEQIKLHKPDLLLVNLTSAITFGVLSKLRDVAVNAKIILWVQEISTELALQSVSLGVRGIVRRTLPVETLIRCLTCVNAGELWFEKALTESLLTARRYSLTRREGQLVALISQGLRNKEIAFQLSISEGTVKVYMSRLFQKLGVNDRFELALYGLRNLAPVSRASDSASVAAAKLGAANLGQPPRSFFVERAAAETTAIEPLARLA